MYAGSETVFVFAYTYLWSQSHRVWKCECCVLFSYSSCIAHMYRLQMHTRYASPSLCINTITRLVYTFAAALLVSYVLALGLSTTSSYRWSCCCCRLLARLQLHFGVDVQRCWFDYTELYDVSLHIELSSPLNKTTTSFVHTKKNNNTLGTTEEDECLTRIWSFLRRLKIYEKNNNNNNIFQYFCLWTCEMKTPRHMFRMQLHTRCWYCVVVVFFLVRSNECMQRYYRAIYGMNTAT